jgi:hypothetical protein
MAAPRMMGSSMAWQSGAALAPVAIPSVGMDGLAVYSPSVAWEREGRLVHVENKVHLTPGTDLLEMDQHKRLVICQ